jgi:hypothetical protein
MGESYAQNVLSEELGRVRSAPAGRRNDQLNKSAFALGQLVRAGRLEREEVSVALYDAAVECSLVRDDGETKARATIESGLKAGIAKPRQDRNDGTRGSGSGERSPASGDGGGVSVDDFYAHMPTHGYIFAPNGEMWPASSVDARLAPITTADAGGEKPKIMKPSSWLDINRAVEQMTWQPGAPIVIEDKLIAEGGWFDRAGCRCFNLYRPPTIALGDPKQAEPWLKHIRKVYGDLSEHIIHWLAHRIQKPAEKINHALVLGGPPGVGKDTLLEPIKAAVGHWNFGEVSPQQLLGRFNGFLKNVILRVSEARDLGEVDRYKFYEHMKAYIASPPDVLRVDEKNLREHAVPNVVGIVITTNYREQGIYLPPDDRRHFVAWTNLEKEDFPQGYWGALWSWYENGGRGHVAAYLFTVDISDFNAKAPPPKTDAWRAIVAGSLAPEDAEMADALDKLGNPDVLILDQVYSAANAGFEIWLRDRANRPRIPHRFDKCGYAPLTNPEAKDGCWKINGRRQTIYARKDKTIREQIEAAETEFGIYCRGAKTSEEPSPL